jgi:hypothetical protein
MATPEIIFPILIMVAPILGLGALLFTVIFGSRTQTASRRSAALGSAGGASAYGSPMDTYSSASMAFDTGSVDCGPIDCGSVDCGTSGCD